MKALIIEDEKAAVRNLIALLQDVSPETEVIGETDSIRDTIAWLSEHRMPDLIFMDIHLADGSAFEIFSHVDIHCPVIFTTAYDEYAMRAFKVNSIDYLLKPIGRSDMRGAMEKLHRLCGQNLTTAERVPDYFALLDAFRTPQRYKSLFLVPVKGDKLKPVPVDSVSFFYIDEGIIRCCLNDGHQHIFSHTLDELGEMIDPRLFFRVNRQYLVSRHAIRDVDLWFNGRLAVNLTFPVDDKILISRARVPEFKDWFTG